MPSRIGLHRLSGFGKQPFLERQARLEAAEPAKFLAGFLPRVEVEKRLPPNSPCFFHRNHAELERRAISANSRRGSEFATTERPRPRSRWRSIGRLAD